MSAIEAEDNSYKRHYIIGKIINEICFVERQGCIIKLIFVPSHSGIHGNEVADRLAQESLIDPHYTIEYQNHFTDLWTAQMVVQTEKWQQQWSLSDKGRYWYSILPNVKTKPWYLNAPWNFHHTFRCPLYCPDYE